MRRACPSSPRRDPDRNARAAEAVAAQTKRQADTSTPAAHGRVGQRLPPGVAPRAGRRRRDPPHGPPRRAPPKAPACGAHRGSRPPTGRTNWPIHQHRPSPPRLPPHASRRPPPTPSHHPLPSTPSLSSPPFPDATHYRIQERMRRRDGRGAPPHRAPLARSPAVVRGARVPSRLTHTGGGPPQPPLQPLPTPPSPPPPLPPPPSPPSPSPPRRPLWGARGWNGPRTVRPPSSRRARRRRRGCNRGHTSAGGVASGRHGGEDDDHARPAVCR